METLASGNRDSIYQLKCGFSGGPVQSHGGVGWCSIDRDDENQCGIVKVLGEAYREIVLEQMVAG